MSGFSSSGSASLRASSARSSSSQRRSAAGRLCFRPCSAALSSRGSRSTSSASSATTGSQASSRRWRWPVVASATGACPLHRERGIGRAGGPLGADRCEPGLDGRAVAAFFGRARTNTRGGQCGRGRCRCLQRPHYRRLLCHRTGDRRTWRQRPGGKPADLRRRDDPGAVRAGPRFRRVDLSVQLARWSCPSTWASDWLPARWRRSTCACSAGCRISFTPGVCLAGSNREDYAGAIAAKWEKKWHPEIEPPEIALPQHAAILRTWMQALS